MKREEQTVHRTVSTVAIMLVLATLQCCEVAPAQTLYKSVMDTSTISHNYAKGDSVFITGKPLQLVRLYATNDSGTGKVVWFNGNDTTFGNALLILGPGESAKLDPFATAGFLRRKSTGGAVKQRTIVN